MPLPCSPTPYGALPGLIGSLGSRRADSQEYKTIKNCQRERERERENRITRRMPEISHRTSHARPTATHLFWSFYVLLSSHRDGPLETVRPARNSFCTLLGVPLPVSKVVALVEV